MKQDKYIFPAIFIYNDSISVYFPDLDGCISDGADEQSALESAREALSLHLFGMEQDGDEIPEPSKMTDIKLEENEKTVLVDVYMPVFRDKMSKKAVRKAVSIPAYLDAAAEAAKISLSYELQEALKRRLGLQ